LAEGGIRNRTGIIAPAQQSAVEILIEANGWPEGEYRFGLQISSNAAGEPLLFPMMLSLNDTTGLPDGGNPAVPLEFGIRALYPNPFNSEVRIEFALPDSRLTTVKAYDLTGREVAVIFDETAQAGLHRMVWDGSRLASGVYFIRLEAGGRAQTAKLALVR
jgi:hypothetical protein